MSPARKKKRSVGGAWQARRLERKLLLAGMGALAVGFLSVWLVKLSNAPALDFRQWIPFAAWMAAVMMVHLAFVLMRFEGDQVLASIALFLSGLGVLAQFRMGSYVLDNPAHLANYALPLGLLLMVTIVAVLRGKRYRALEHFGLLALIVALGVLAVILVLGRRYRGMIFLPGNINPAEIAKILLVIFLAAFLSLHRKELEKSQIGIPTPPLGTILTLAGLWLTPMGLLLLQRDLGMVVQLNGVLVVLLFVATGHAFYGLAAGAGVVGAGFAIINFGLHGARRISVWLDPFEDPTGRGWQVLQGLSALFSGGLLGAGLGAGSPTNIPIASSDFVYAAIGEELGYVGCGLVIVLFLFLFHRGFVIARHLKDPFAQLLVTGLTASLVVQTLLNIGGVTKAVPLTGITLPFISHGGSSLVTSFAMIGLLLAASEEVGARMPAAKTAPKSRKSNRRTRAATSAHRAAKRKPSGSRKTTQKGR